MKMKMKKRASIGPALLFLFTCLFSSAQLYAANLLVFGDRTTDKANLETSLTNLGHTVTNVGALPADLSGYDGIWHVMATSAVLTPADQTQLAAYLASGGGLHLTGERPCCEGLNDTVEAFVNSVVIGGGIQVGDLGDIGGPYNVNSSAAGGIANTPNNLTVWNPSASGGMGGLGSLPDSNIFTTGAGGVPTGAVWVEQDLVSGGRLTLLMDVNWFSNTDTDNLNMVENIVDFQLSATGGSAGPTPPAAFQQIPTMPQWAMILLAAFMVLAAVTRGRQRLIAK